jgi:hypothetical protein
MSVLKRYGHLAVYLGLIVLVPQSSFALKCYVVSGLDFDHNGAFSNVKQYYSYKNANVRGEKCIIVDCYRNKTCTYSLEAQLTQLKNLESSSPDQRKNDIAIFQVGHGNEGGSVQLNGGTEENVFSFLNDLAKERKVFANLDSCFSGDVMREKLLWDMTNKSNSDSTKNLCLQTSSNFNRTSNALAPDPMYYLNVHKHSQKEIKNGKDLAKSMLANNAKWMNSTQSSMPQFPDVRIYPSQMMSSASTWSRLGLDQYLYAKNKGHADAYLLLDLQYFDSTISDSFQSGALGFKNEMNKRSYEYYKKRGVLEDDFEIPDTLGAEYIKLTRAENVNAQLITDKIMELMAVIENHMSNIQEHSYADFLKLMSLPLHNHGDYFDATTFQHLRTLDQIARQELKTRLTIHDFEFMMKNFPDLMKKSLTRELIEIETKLRELNRNGQQDSLKYTSSILGTILNFKSGNVYSDIAKSFEKMTSAKYELGTVLISLPRMLPEKNREDWMVIKLQDASRLDSNFPPFSDYYTTDQLNNYLRQNIINNADFTEVDENPYKERRKALVAALFNATEIGGEEHKSERYESAWNAWQVRTLERHDSQFGSEHFSILNHSLLDETRYQACQNFVFPTPFSMARPEYEIFVTTHPKKIIGIKILPSQIKTLKIYDLSRNVVPESTYTTKHMKESVTIDYSKLKLGTYILVLTDNTETNQIRKFVSN